MIITELDLGYNRDNIFDVAQNGNVSAQEAIATQYLYDGVLFDDSPDWDKALYWLKKAAKNKSIFAQRCLKRLEKSPDDKTFGGMCATSKKLINNEDA